MKKVGLTGGIGSGKTTATLIFKQLGIPIYNSDVRAKVLMSNNIFLKESIQILLGSEAYNDGTLNRSYVASKVFNDKLLLNQLNILVHPVVKKDFEIWCNSKDAPYVIKEAAIIFESGFLSDLDSYILIESPKNLKINRVMLRDNCSRSKVIGRMKEQWSDDKKRLYADYILINDEKKSLLSQVLNVNQLILKSI